MKGGKNRNILITGGAGFIGSNLAERLLQQPGTHVRIFDNLCRAGVTHNLEWLRSVAPAGRFEFAPGDVRDRTSLHEAARDATEIYHLAAQVAVTSSIENPVEDFEVNACGTLNLLEVARRSMKKPFLLFTSTNKVYGALKSLEIVDEETRCRAQDLTFAGTSEQQPLDFHSPYGCSKGAADQYVLDYARIYSLPAVVFRMSCIAGPRQFGNEDQGWVAHFLYSALEHARISIYGSGKQVRDVLHVSDLIDAMALVFNAGSLCHGQVYNLGGGPSRAVSVLDLLHLIEEWVQEPVATVHGLTRPGDQPLYISDTRKLFSHTGWRPRRSLEQALEDIRQFWHGHRSQIAQVRRETSAPALAEEVA